MTLDEFMQAKNKMVRLPACRLYKIDPTARDNRTKLKGGYSIYLRTRQAKEGLTLVNREVVKVKVDEADPSDWYIVEEYKAA